MQDSIYHMTPKSHCIIEVLKQITHLCSPEIALDEPILDQQGSYTDERQSFTRRYA